MEDRPKRFTNDSFISVVVIGTLHAIGIDLNTAFDMVTSGLTNLL